MHRPLVPRNHAKSTETQGNAAKIVFVDLNGWQHRPKPLAPQIRDFHVPVNSPSQECTHTKFARAETIAASILFPMRCHSVGIDCPFSRCLTHLAITERHSAS